MINQHLCLLTVILLPCLHLLTVHNVCHLTDNARKPCCIHRHRVSTTVLLISNKDSRTTTNTAQQLKNSTIDPSTRTAHGQFTNKSEDIRTHALVYSVNTRTEQSLKVPNMVTTELRQRMTKHYMTVTQYDHMRQ